jgi:KaiC/GvpD/RAD55 family RecA-like ATPase
MFLEELHDKYQKDLTHEEYALYVLSKVPEKEHELYIEILETIKDSSTDSSILEDILLDLQQKQQAYQLAVQALEVSEGRKPYSDLLVSVKDLNATESVLDPSMSFVSNDLEELYNNRIKTPGLRWRLDGLNKMMGSLRKGNFGFIFARPETGKTTFLASEGTNFAMQVELLLNADKEAGPVLWLNNEQAGDEVMFRIYQAMFGITLEQLFNDIKGYKQKFIEGPGKHFRLFDSAAIHKRQVELLCESLKPSLVIMDTIDKIKGFNDDREDLRLGAIYIWARELAKQYCPVIAVCQADATGEGKKWLTMENVANAKTAKQAEADFILGIGKTHDANNEYLRYFHLSKNKLQGDSDTLQDLRHGRIEVAIRQEIGRYEDIHIFK